MLLRIGLLVKAVLLALEVLLPVVVLVHIPPATVRLPTISEGRHIFAHSGTSALALVSTARTHHLRIPIELCDYVPLETFDAATLDSPKDDQPFSQSPAEDSVNSPGQIDRDSMSVVLPRVLEILESSSYPSERDIALVQALRRYLSTSDGLERQHRRPDSNVRVKVSSMPKPIVFPADACSIHDYTIAPQPTCAANGTQWNNADGMGHYQVLARFASFPQKSARVKSQWVSVKNTYACAAILGLVGAVAMLLLMIRSRLNLAHLVPAPSSAIDPRYFGVNMDRLSLFASDALGGETAGTPLMQSSSSERSFWALYNELSSECIPLPEKMADAKAIGSTKPLKIRSARVMQSVGVQTEAEEDKSCPPSKSAPPATPISRRRAPSASSAHTDRFSTPIARLQYSIVLDTSRGDREEGGSRRCAARALCPATPLGHRSAQRVPVLTSRGQTLTPLQYNIASESPVGGEGQAEGQEDEDEGEDDEDEGSENLNNNFLLYHDNRLAKFLAYEVRQIHGAPGSMRWIRVETPPHLRVYRLKYVDPAAVAFRADLAEYLAVVRARNELEETLRQVYPGGACAQAIQKIYGSPV
ncbi:hypothetical protein BOTBODRAFT_58308 [Botryobasidium botryosum FD-172 SS1]|uniref:Transmembrane protein n=1 Tax=Botryobasidium botryosum (strain FD-172 SS1) TaxID=930990 RepID=A0A067MEU5_BOTB1|nr:hypothetical protein BOTBODRAFT_58308 [Botryobasidium botryosum FD-172 SS1]